MTLPHLAGINWVWIQLDPVGCVLLGLPRVASYSHIINHPQHILLMINGRGTRSQIKIIQMHLESLLMLCTAAIHLPNKLPGPIQHKPGRYIYSACSSGKCYKVTCQKVKKHNSVTEREQRIGNKNQIRPIFPDKVGP